MQNYLVECAYNSKDDLGESPIWIEEQNSIFWVDIKRSIIHELNIKSNIHTSWSFNDSIESIGCIAHIKNNKFMPIASSLLNKPRLVKKLRDFYNYVQKNDGKVGNKTRGIDLNFNNACNLRCKYCFTNSPMFSPLWPKAGPTGGP